MTSSVRASILITIFWFYFLMIMSVFFDCSPKRISFFKDSSNAKEVKGAVFWGSHISHHGFSLIDAMLVLHCATGTRYFISFCLSPLFSKVDSTIFFGMQIFSPPLSSKLPWRVATASPISMFWFDNEMLLLGNVTLERKHSTRSKLTSLTSFFLI